MLFFFAFEENRWGVCKGGRTREMVGLFFLFFSALEEQKECILCEGISLFRDSFHGDQSFIFIYIHRGATAQSVRDFMPNFRPASHEMDCLCPHKYKLSVTMTTQGFCLQENERDLVLVYSACCC